ncbi:MAG: adenylate/guanylate cyclase domain-containing protein [Candidatus Limnocylindrales bacterium]
MTVDEDPVTARWRAMLLGTDESLLKVRRFWRRLPSAPRCKVCASPFHGPGGLLAKVVFRGESPKHPLICNACIGPLAKHPGGAEIEISVLFADVRGSTGIAERTSAAEFRRLLQQFYEVSAAAIDRNGGIVDKFLGDGVMALFIPVITGENHARGAVMAGRELLEGAARLGGADRRLPVGAGLHTGTAFVGVLGSGDRLDFSALGDTVNVATRLGSLAAAGEFLVSSMAWSAAVLGMAPGDARPADGALRREVDIAGRTAPLEVIVDMPGSVTAGSG